MKKLAVLVFSLGCASSLLGCGKNAAKDSEPPKVQKEDPRLKVSGTDTPGAGEKAKAGVQAQQN